LPSREVAPDLLVLRLNLFPGRVRGDVDSKQTEARAPISSFPGIIPRTCLKGIDSVGAR
jgi:hypothetical protein